MNSFKNIFLFLSVVLFLGPLHAEGGVDRYVRPYASTDFTAIGTPNDCTNLAYAP